MMLIKSQIVPPPSPPYPIGRRPFLYPCIRPELPARPPGDPSRVFKRFDPHEFDDPKSLEGAGADDDLSSDDEDGKDDGQPASHVPTTYAAVVAQPQPQSQAQLSSSGQVPASAHATASGASDQGQQATLNDLGLGDPTGGELDYDTQAYQSLAALLEASNDDIGLFGQSEGGDGGTV